MRHCRSACVLLALLAARPAAAAPPAGENLLGHRGLVRTVAALNHPQGLVGLGTDLQFFKASDLLAQGASHSRMANSFTLTWAPLRFLEGAFGFHVISDSTSGSADELQVAVGDPEISLKGSYAFHNGLGLGALFDIRFPSGVGFFEAAGTAAIVNVAALASWTGGVRLPLSLHLNLGMIIDGSENLFDAATLSQLTASQRFAVQLSSFNRFGARVGIEYDTRYLGPFLEVGFEPFLGSGAPSFSRSPGILTFGARVWPSKSHGLQLLAALDLALTGVGDGTSPTDAADKYAFVLPRWNLIFRASYRFDPFAKPAARHTEVGDQPPPPAPKRGVATGVVLDERTGSPVAAAQVAVAAGDEGTVSRLAVDPERAEFRTYPLAAGRRSLTVSATGYETATIAVQIEADRETPVQVRLRPKLSIAPGTIRGTVKGLGQGGAVEATVLIPELDQTVQVSPDGTFTVEVKPGTYTVNISAPGYRTQRKSLRVEESSAVILNVELYKR